MAKAKVSTKAVALAPLSERALDALKLLRTAPKGGYSTASIEFNLYWEQNSGHPEMKALLEHGKVTVRKTMVGNIDMFEVKK